MKLTREQALARLEAGATDVEGKLSGTWHRLRHNFTSLQWQDACGFWPSVQSFFGWTEFRDSRPEETPMEDIVFTKDSTLEPGGWKRSADGSFSHPIGDWLPLTAARQLVKDGVLTHVKPPTKEALEDALMSREHLSGFTTAVSTKAYEAWKAHILKEREGK